MEKSVQKQQNWTQEREAFHGNMMPWKVYNIFFESVLTLLLKNQETMAWFSRSKARTGPGSQPLSEFGKRTRIQDKKDRAIRQFNSMIKELVFRADMMDIPPGELDLQGLAALLVSPDFPQLKGLDIDKQFAIIDKKHGAEKAMQTPLLRTVEAASKRYCWRHPINCAGWTKMLWNNVTRQGNKVDVNTEGLISAILEDRDNVGKALYEVLKSANRTPEYKQFLELAGISQADMKTPGSFTRAVLRKLLYLCRHNDGNECHTIRKQLMTVSDWAEAVSQHAYKPRSRQQYGRQQYAPELSKLDDTKLRSSKQRTSTAQHRPAQDRLVQSGLEIPSEEILSTETLYTDSVSPSTAVLGEFESEEESSDLEGDDIGSLVKVPSYEKTTEDTTEDTFDTDSLVEVTDEPQWVEEYNEEEDDSLVKY